MLLRPWWLLAATYGAAAASTDLRHGRKAARADAGHLTSFQEAKGRLVAIATEASGAVASLAAAVRSEVLSAQADAAERRAGLGLLVRGPEQAGPATLSEYCKGGDPPGIQKGERVEADWKGFGNFYPGKVREENSDGTFDIDYDDGYTETMVKKDSIRDIPDIEIPKRKGKGGDPASDPVCQLNEFVEKVKEKVIKVKAKVKEWSARKQGAVTEEERKQQDADKSGSAGASSMDSLDKAEREGRDQESGSPSPAPVATEPPLPPGTPEQVSEFEALRKTLAQKDDELAALEDQISDNEDRINALEGLDGGARTMDQLIADYKNRIRARDQKIQELKKKIANQEEQLEALSGNTVSLPEIQSDIADISKDVDDATLKRQKLQEEGELDAELRSGLDTIIASNKALKEQIKALIEAEEKARAQREAARKQAEQKAMHGPTEGPKALAKMEADLQQAEKEALTAAAAMENKLDGMQSGAQKLDTGVHPHGAKWWRYRYEHAYVEAIIMVIVSILMLIWERLFYYMRRKAYEWSKAQPHDFTTQGTMYIAWLEYASGELMVCLFVFLTCWVFAQLGVWALLQKILVADDNMHLPNTAEEYKKLAMDICVVLFFAIVFYYFLISTVVYCTTDLLENWTLMEDRRKRIGRSFAPEEKREKAKRRWLTSWTNFFGGSHHDFVQLRQYFFLYVQGDDDLLRAIEASVPGGLVKESFPFEVYLKICVRDTVDLLFQFGLWVWALIIVTFGVFIVLHRHLHVGYAHIMGVYGMVLVVMLTLMGFGIFKITSQVRYLAQQGEDISPRSRQTKSIHNEYATEVVMIFVLHYLVFMFCYGAARIICQPWMWELHFRITVMLTGMIVLLSLVFILLIAPLIPLFAAALSVPPYIDPGDVQAIVSAVRVSREMTAKEASAAAEEERQAASASVSTRA